MAIKENTIYTIKNYWFLFVEITHLRIWKAKAIEINETFLNRQSGHVAKCSLHTNCTHNKYTPGTNIVQANGCLLKLNQGFAVTLVYCVLGNTIDAFLFLFSKMTIA